MKRPRKALNFSGLLVQEPCKCVIDGVRKGIWQKFLLCTRKIPLFTWAHQSLHNEGMHSMNMDSLGTGSMYCIYCSARKFKLGTELLILP